MGGKFKVFDDKTFELYQFFYDRDKAKLRGEKLKLTGDIRFYRVEEADHREDVYYLWVH